METIAIASTLSDYRTDVGDDAALAARARAGDGEALAELLARHAPTVRRWVARLVAQADVDDLVQDVWAIAIERGRQYRRGAAWRTWLLSIALNRCRSHQRRARLRRRWLAWATVQPPMRVAPSADPRLDAALAELRQADREVLVLRYYEDLSIAELAEALGIAAGAVEVRLSRARARLKRILETPESADRT